MHAGCSHVTEKAAFIDSLEDCNITAATLHPLPLRLIVYNIRDSFSELEQVIFTQRILPGRLAERVWWTKLQFSLLNIYSRLLEVGSNPRSCSHLFTLRRRIAESYLIYSSRANSRSARRRFIPLQKPSRIHRFLCVKRGSIQYGFWVVV